MSFIDEPEKVEWFKMASYTYRRMIFPLAMDISPNKKVFGTFDLAEQIGCEKPENVGYFLEIPAVGFYALGNDLRKVTAAVARSDESIIVRLASSLPRLNGSEDLLHTFYCACDEYCEHERLELDRIIQNVKRRFKLQVVK